MVEGELRVGERFVWAPNSNEPNADRRCTIKYVRPRDHQCDYIPYDDILGTVEITFDGDHEHLGTICFVDYFRHMCEREPRQDRIERDRIVGVIDAMIAEETARELVEQRIPNCSLLYALKRRICS